MGHYTYNGPYPADVELPDGKMTIVFVEPGEVITVDDELDSAMEEDGRWGPSDTPPEQVPPPGDAVDTNAHEMGAVSASGSPVAEATPTDAHPTPPEGNTEPEVN